MDSKLVEDDVGAQATIRDTQDRRIPDDLVRQLHEANTRFDHLKGELEKTLGDSKYDHAARAKQASDALRGAERTVEEITERIHQASPPQAGVGGSGGEV